MAWRAAEILEPLADDIQAKRIAFGHKGEPNEQRQEHERPVRAHSVYMLRTGVVFLFTAVFKSSGKI